MGVECFDCGSGDVQECSELTSFRREGSEYSADYLYLKCATCGSEWVTDQMLIANEAAREGVVASIRGNLKWSIVPEDIAEDVINGDDISLITALLIVNNIIRVSSDEAGATMLLVNCNDVFMWACGDCEPVSTEDLWSLYNHVVLDSIWGSAVWVCVKRNMLPQRPVYDAIQSTKTWDLDSFGLAANPTW